MSAVLGILLVSAALTRQAASSTADANWVQSPAGTIHHFDAVSVKPCDSKSPGASGSRYTGAGASFSRGYSVEDCLTLFSMIRNAYIRFADGRGHDPWASSETSIEGGPDWIKHDTFLVEATAAGASQEMMRGPLLQAALEDRFHLRLHHDSREGPVYELAVAAGGLKLKPAVPGTCVPPDWTVFPPPQLSEGRHYCQLTGEVVDQLGNRLLRPIGGPDYIMAWDDEGLTLEELARDFLHLDRPVVNKTGISGRFQLHLVHHANLSGPQDESPVRNAHTAAVELKTQLGLELKPSTGSRDFIVIDHVERPTPDEHVVSFRSTAK